MNNFLKILCIIIIFYILYNLFNKKSCFCIYETSSETINNLFNKFKTNDVNEDNKVDNLIILNDSENKIETFDYILAEENNDVSIPETISNPFSLSYSKLTGSNIIPSIQNTNLEFNSMLNTKAPKNVTANISTNVDTNKITIEYPVVYPISSDPTFDNLNNLTDNTTINKINELTQMSIDKANSKSHVIIYNPQLIQVQSIPMNTDESTDYGKFLTETINSVAIYKWFKFNRVINISKDQVENQMRLNFHLELLYNNPDINEDITLTFNVVFLFERLYDDDDKFFEQNNEKNKEIFVYLESFRLIGLPNNGFLSGYEK